MVSNKDSQENNHFWFYTPCYPPYNPQTPFIPWVGQSHNFTPLQLTNEVNTSYQFAELIAQQINQSDPIREDLQVERQIQVGQQISPNNNQVEVIVHEPINIILTREDLISHFQEPKRKKEIWTKQEDQRLVYLSSKKKLTFKQIGLLMLKNQKDCYNRFKSLNSPKLIGWRECQDDKLIKLVQEKGQNWQIISKQFSKKDRKSIERRYKDFLRPDLDKSEWRIEEDFLLVDLLKIHGKNWKVIQAVIFWRSSHYIRNRFFKKIKKLNESKLKKQQQQ